MKQEHNTQKNRRTRGQAIAEYLIITALVAIGSVAVIQLLSRNVQLGLAKMSDSISGNSSQVRDRRGIKSQHKHYKIRDLGDFADEITDTSSE